MAANSDPLVYDYTGLAGFEHVLLEDSWVRDVVIKPTSVRLAVDVVLTPEHPRYSPIHPGEQHCYLAATITFEAVGSLEWTGRPSASNHDPDGSVDYGNIDTLARRPGRFVLVGDFGELDLTTVLPPGIELGP